ncbi:glycoprotein precursor [Universidad Nacional virus 1]|uniref:Glycoprotein n=1 Tax=Universidad Nacional virus 1 TaxID=2970745 RepID=A0AAX3C3U8_9VIRU|nr:glycoprotein precursor [Universidad Nacional virus 1]UUM00586.1 glycoprotein precursor [Universidad Nacional virus 1]
MGAFVSISETFVAIVKHIPLIVFILVLVWFLFMCLRGRWWKVLFLLFLTPKCQAYIFCSQNEFNLCSEVTSTIETKYHVIDVENQTIITKLLKDSYYFNIMTLSNCTANEHFDVVDQKQVMVNASETPGCQGGWLDNNYYDSYNCRNITEQKKGLRYHGPFGDPPVGFWALDNYEATSVEKKNLYNITFKWKKHDYSKHIFDLFQNFTKVHCTNYKYNCTNSTTSHGSIVSKCKTAPLPVLQRIKRSSVSLSSTTSVFSLIALDTGYSDSSALWENLLRTQTALENLEKIIGNLTNNQLMLAGQINIDQITIGNILTDLKTHGVKLERAEKSFNNSHLCIMRNEKFDLTHYVRVNHTHDNGAFNHDCVKLILVNDSLSGLIHMTQKAHEEALRGLRTELLRNYLLTVRWEYPTTLFLLTLGVFFIILQKKAYMHRHYKKGDEWKCPYPHYPNKKGHCSCGKTFDQVKLIECPIEKY